MNLTELVRQFDAAMDDQAVADAMKVENIPCRRLLTSKEMKRALLRMMIWPVLLVSTGAAAKAIVDYLNDQRFETVDMDLPEVKAMIGGIVASGDATTEQASELDEMANCLRSLEQIHGLGNVDSGQIAEARKAAQ